MKCDLTKKETTKKLLKNETCQYCKYYRIYKFGSLHVCTRTNNDSSLPTEQTCKEFKRGNTLGVNWTLDNSNPVIYYNDKKRDNKETT
jgi:hypothetical protein